MNSLREMWESRSASARAGIVAGALLIVILVAGIGFWAYRADYQVLFADLSSGDAASMTAELDKMKVPYQLTDGGNTITVPKDMVYKTRLKLMNQDLPLHGAVGFEVFNNADFGMTEFVQKVNYQRAIQGELTRTIMSIDGVQSARVHIAMPEQGLFKKNSSQTKASVTVAMKSGNELAPEQIRGIQRLVAASVPDISPSDVTVLDQHGVALTRAASSETGADFADAQLDSKRSTEEYLVRKVTQVLDQTLGAGEAIATVNVVLNMDQSKITTEEVLPAKGTVESGSPAGVVVHERQTTHDDGAAAAGSGTGNRNAAPSTTTSTESDYQVGRRVAQSVTAPGAISRMTVAVVVKKSLSDEQIAKLKEVVGLAVGIDPQRGDGIVVESMGKIASSGSPSATGVAQMEPADASSGMAAGPNMPLAATRLVTIWALCALLAVVLISAAAYAGLRASGTPRRKILSPQERERMLREVRNWINEPSVSEEAIGARE